MAHDLHDERWTISSRCDASNCVQVAFGPQGVAVRSSARDDPRLVFHPDDWRAFIALLKAEPGAGGAVSA
jgi:hypothetical protein